MEQTALIVDPTQELRPWLGIAPEAWKILIPLWMGTLLLIGLLTLTVLGKWLVLPLIGLALFCSYFFRDPERTIPSGDGLLVSPADGRVLSVQEVKDGPYVSTPHLRVSIFMSVFNVHVNRTPIDGKVSKVIYHPGKFHMAMVDKASLDNEQQAVYLQRGAKQIIFVQIAGWVARRIINHLKEGQEVMTGTRCGLICFGSRVDIYLPLDAKIRVKPGETMVAGESIIGEL